MPSTIAIRRRIRSVKSTKQITKAMELVAASKMRRAQELTLKSRPYSNAAREILTALDESADLSNHPLFIKRDVKSRLYVVVTSDRGLAGAYNSNLLKLFIDRLKQDKAQDITSKAILIGKQAARFSARLKGLEVLAVYPGLSGKIEEKDLRPVVTTILEQYKTGIIERTRNGIRSKIANIYTDHEQDDNSVTGVFGVEEVVVLFTDFISSINQTATAVTILPINYDKAESPENFKDTIFEPTLSRVVDQIAPRLMEAQLMQYFLESQASEHIARMMAMKSASDNASDIIDSLTLALNSARQASITQELAEISGGAEAIK